MVRQEEEPPSSKTVEHRQRGSDLFKAGKFADARKCYSAALEVNDQPPESLASLAALHTNRAVCHLREGNLRKAIVESDRALALDARWVRGYQRKAEAELRLRKYVDAGRTIESGLAVAPSDKVLQAKKNELEQQIAQSKSSSANAPLGAQRVTKEMAVARQHMRTSAPSREESAELQAHAAHFEATTQRGIECENADDADISAAISLYEKGALGGCTVAMDALSRIFMHGQGGAPVDYGLGVSWATRCVEHGPSVMARVMLNSHDTALLSATGRLGQAHRHGWGVAKDAAKAGELLRRAAEAGDVVTQNNFGSWLNESEGAHVESFGWYLEAAEAGYSLAMTNVGAALEQGVGCDRDEAAALEWLRRAAALGCHEAAKRVASRLAADERVDSRDVAAHWTRVLDTQERDDSRVSNATAMQAFASLLERQERDDAATSTDGVRARLAALGVQPVPFAVDDGGGDSLRLDEHREQLLRQWLENRGLTDLEKRAVEICKRAAATEGACAKTLGDFFLRRADVGNALEAYLGGARLADSDAACEAGRLLWEHEPRDPKRATKYLRQAARAGSARAAALLLALRDELEEKSGSPSSSSSAGAAAGAAPPEEAEEDGGVRPSPQQLRDLKAAIRASSASTSGTSGRLLEEMPWELAERMRPYLLAHPDSYTGHGIYYALQLQYRSLCEATSGAVDRAVDLCALAYLTDEKGWQMALSVDDATGEVDFGLECMRHVRDAAAGRLARRKDDAFAALALLALQLPGSDETFRERRRLVDAAIRAVETGSAPQPVRRARPRLLQLRGCFTAYTGDFEAARRDFEAALALLRGDAACSLWPDDPLHREAPGASIRATMVAAVELDIGRTCVYLRRPNYGLAVSKIRTFIATVPTDTHYYAQAHYELARALLDQARIDGSESKRLPELEALIDGAATATDVPVFKPLTDRDFPMMAQVRGVVAALQFRRQRPDPKKTPPRPEECWACRRSPHAAASKLRACNRCRVAQYCSRECQVAHWRKAHKHVCKSLQKEAT